MLLFWKKTTAKGIAASITTGIISALNDERIITEKGGFLFKAFGAGERLIPGVTPDGTFDILFRPLSTELSPEDIRKYTDIYVILARFLLENGYSGHGRLDTVTVSLLGEAELFNPVPEDLAGLASETCSLDEQYT